MSDTPETDAFITQNPAPTTHQLKNFARILERERDEAREKIDNIRNTLSKNGEAVGNGDYSYSVIEMVENLLKSKDFFLRKSNSLQSERDDAQAALMKIEDLFIDGTDTWADRENMGMIARAALEGVE